MIEFKAEYAIDGTTYGLPWMPSTASVNEWLQVDLGKKEKITSILLFQKYLPTCQMPNEIDFCLQQNVAPLRSICVTERRRQQAVLKIRCPQTYPCPKISWSQQHNFFQLYTTGRPPCASISFAMLYMAMTFIIPPSGTPT